MNNRLWDRIFTEEDIRRVLQELSDEEREDNIDCSDIENEFEEEKVTHDLHKSESDQSAESEVEDADGTVAEDYSFFIGKDLETIWCSIPVASQGKTRAKNIVKVFAGPKQMARDTPIEMDAFLKILDFDIIDSIVHNTNIHRQKTFKCTIF